MNDAITTLNDILTVKYALFPKQKGRKLTISQKEALMVASYNSLSCVISHSCYGWCRSTKRMPEISKMSERNRSF
jgi:hypothetical protein